MIVCASVTGDTPFPATAVWVQEKLGLSCPAFDVNAACAGFSYGAGYRHRHSSSPGWPTRSC